MQRNTLALTDEHFDLLVLGGGITGAGVALDAALRGLRVALIDKRDFASGTSSVSSKLVHGGLRYLEHGSFHLVYEALHERRLLLQNAPHLVQPLRFVIPFYSQSRVPRWKWRLGLKLYDWLAGKSNIAPSEALSARSLLDELPDLRREGLQGGAAYWDAQMDDARLCIEVLRTATRAGALAANYVAAIAFEHQGGLLAGVRARDQVTGAEVTIRARQILNATGPWVDAVCRLAGDSGVPHLRPTKGVHLLAPDRGLQSALLLLHPVDGRVFFVIPWLGRTLIGTTDSITKESPDALAVLPEEVAYLLQGYAHYFGLPLKAEEILGTFVGLRPLIRGRPGRPASFSREFELFAARNGLLSAAGGKYTTYRRMAEQITDAIAARLGRKIPGRTRNYPLDGAPSEPWPEFRQRTAESLASAGLDKKAAHHLVCRYGRRAAEVVAYLEENASLAEPVLSCEPEIRAELCFQRDHEMALFPEDYFLRRTRLGLFHPDALDRLTKQIP